MTTGPQGATDAAADGKRPPLRERLVAALSSRACLAAILALAAVLRVAHVLSLRPVPLFDRLIIDSELYDAWAQRIAAGDWLSNVLGRPFYMDPLYPYFLGVVYRAVGRDLLLVRLLQVAMGVATCWIVARLATRLDGPLAGNVAAALVAAFAPSIFQEGEFEKTALGVLLATGALLLFLRDGWRSKLAAGAMLGLAALTRGNILLVGAAAVAYLIVIRAPRAALTFAAGAALVIAPVTARNVAVSGEWVLAVSGAGQNLYTGNNPANPDGAYHSVPFARPQTAHEEGDFLAEAERRAGRPLTAREASAFWTRETVRHVAAQPAFAARVLARKIALFWSDVEVADAWEMAFVAGFSPVLRLPLVSFAVLLGLAVLGVAAASRSRDGRIVVAYVLLYAASVIAFFIFSRYRLHVVPPLAALAGVGVVSAGRDAARGGWRALPWRALALGLVVGGASIASFPDRRGAPVGNYAMLAEMYQERGDFVRARQILGDALALDPSAASTLCALGTLELRSGDAARALDQARRCVQANPVFPDGWYLVGLALEASGDRRQAMAAYRQQLALVPGHELSRARLALPAQ
jgi:tetratricopeptide (TPR) repeat protein